MRLVALLAVLGLSAPAYANWMSYGPGGGIAGAGSHGGGHGYNSNAGGRGSVSMANHLWPNAGRANPGSAGEGAYSLRGGGAGTRITGATGYEGGAWTAGGGPTKLRAGQSRALMTASPDNSKAFLVVETAQGAVKWHIPDGRTYKQLKGRLGLRMGKPLPIMEAKSFDAITLVEAQPTF